MLEVITGCMFSGKTTRFIERVKELKAEGKTVIVLKPEEDVRYSEDHVVSHDGVQIQGLSIDETDQIWEFVEDCDVIALDEVQFFGWDFAETVNEIANQGIHVLAAGLDLDFRGRSFGIIPELMALADTVTKLSGNCSECGELASRSQRLVNGFPAKESDPVYVETADDLIQYEPRCRRHHEVERNK